MIDVMKQPLTAPDREGSSEPTGLKVVSYEQCAKALEHVSRHRPAFLWRMAVYENLGINETDLLESMFASMDTSKPIHKLFKGSKKSLDAYVKYRSVFSNRQGMTISYEWVASQIGNSVAGVKEYLRRYSNLAPAFRVTLEDAPEELKTTQSNKQHRERPASREKVNYPDVYERAVEQVIQSHWNNRTQFPPINEITPERILAAIPERTRPALWMLRSFLEQNPDFVGNILKKHRGG